MILWTMKPIKVRNICGPAKSSMPEPEFDESYEWLICRMKRRTRIQNISGVPDSLNACELKHVRKQQ